MVYRLLKQKDTDDVSSEYLHIPTFSKDKINILQHRSSMIYRVKIKLI